MTMVDDIDWQKANGQVPAIVQHAVTGRVLMLGFMTLEALAATRNLGRVTFFSRSRQCLWTKGEQSGNWLEFRGLEVDCDRDTLLVQAIPSGPTCHLSTTSCFDRDTEKPGFGFLGELETIIENRMENPSDDSYTRRLVEAGIHEIAKKVGEEGVEVALAATTDSNDDIESEAADLMYHLVVLLKYQKMSISGVVRRLRERHMRAVTIGTDLDIK